MDDRLRKLQREDEEAWYRAALRAGLFTENHSYVKSIAEEICADCERPLRWSNCSRCMLCHNRCNYNPETQSMFKVGYLPGGFDKIITTNVSSCNG